MSDKSTLEHIIEGAAACLAPIAENSAAAPNMRNQFLEMVTVSLGTLYSKMPLPGTLYDRAMLKSISDGTDDNEVAKMTRFGEDWLRLEGVMRAAEGQKAYTLNRPAMAVLSTHTTVGTLGDVMERISRAYAEGTVSADLRRSARQLAAYFLTRIARN